MNVVLYKILTLIIIRQNIAINNTIITNQN